MSSNEKQRKKIKPIANKVHQMWKYRIKELLKLARKWSHLMEPIFLQDEKS